MVGVVKRDDAALKLVADVPVEKLSGGQVGSASDHRVRSGSNEAHVHSPLHAHLRTGCAQLAFGLHSNGEFDVISKARLSGDAVAAELIAELGEIEIRRERESIDEHAAVHHR